MLFSLPALACALQSTHAELPYLQVAAGESSVVVSLEHARAVADLTAERPVVVTAPLAFHAEDRLDRVPLAIEHDVGLYHGVLTLPAGLMLSPIRADADGLTIESPARGLEAHAVCEPELAKVVGPHVRHDEGEGGQGPPQNDLAGVRASSVMRSV